MTAKLISSIALNAGLHGWHAFLDVPINGFEHHDGVIHHDADAQHERQHVRMFTE
jgi:hypothetical protein